MNKGDSTSPKYRSRLVAKEFNTGVNHDLYAATPPSECLRLMLSMLASSRSKDTTLMYADVSRAYFYAKAERPVYVNLPEEDLEPGDEGKCGRLRMSMYGTRDAALNWSKEYGDTLKKSGFIQGKNNPCLFQNKEIDVSIMVHGDDFIAVGSEKNLKTTRAILEDKYKIKVEVLGDKKDQTMELRILNKVVRLTHEGVELEADPRHVELTVRDLGLADARVSTVPGAKEPKLRGSNDDNMSREAASHPPDEVGGNRNMLKKQTLQKGVIKADGRGRGDQWREDDLEADGWNDGDVKSNDEDDPALVGAEATLYRAVAARLNYLAPDRPDIGFSVKEAARAMSAPRQSHMKLIKKLGRYLKGRPRLVSKFKWQTMPEFLTTFTDSDWAGCLKTARSTSGGIVCLGDHTIKTYCKQQKVVALSSAEAELYAMVAASAEAMAVQAYASDLGMSLSSELYADSSAALGIAKRAGIGKVRHLRTQGLWIQEVRISGRIIYKKVLGEKNPSDLLTKYMTAELSMKHLEAINAVFVDGRAESAPEIGNLEKSDGEEALKDNEIEGELISWVRTVVDRGEQKVSFCETVRVRPIAATGLGKSCRGAGRSSRRGRWPETSIANPEDKDEGTIRDARDGGGAGSLPGHSCGMSTDSCEVESTETRWSSELAGDYEYECATREHEGITRGAGLVERSAHSHVNIFGSDNLVGKSSTIEAGVVDAGSGVFEAAVIRPDESAGNVAVALLPIVSCACLGNSCLVASLGSLSRLYDQFIRRRGSARLHPLTNTTCRQAQRQAYVRALPCFLAHPRNAEHPLPGSSALLPKQHLYSHTSSRVFASPAPPTSLAW